MISCAEPLATSGRYALRPMTLRIRRSSHGVRPCVVEHPTLLVVRKGQVHLHSRHGATPAIFGIGWSTLDPSHADYAQELWSTNEGIEYSALELPSDTCRALLQSDAPWMHSGRRPFRFSDPKVAWWIDEIVGHCTAGEPFGGLYTESVSIALLVYLQSRTSQVSLPDGRATPLSRHAVRRICDHIEGHLAVNVSVKDLAALCGYSPGHLNRVFREAMGVPLHRFVIERRLDRARQLLASDTAPLVQIALGCGFANQAHFSTAFRRYVGCTPRVFRATRAR